MRSLFFIGVAITWACTATVACGKLDNGSIPKADTTVVYNLLEQTDSAFRVMKENVAKTTISSNYHQKLYYVDSVLIRIEQFDKGGNLFNHLYSPAITKYTYQQGRVEKVEFYDKNLQRVERPFGGHFSIEYSYDTQNRITGKVHRDKNDQLMAFIADIDISPAYIKYTYKGDEVFAIHYDENHGVVLKKHKATQPCIPYLDCQ